MNLTGAPLYSKEIGAMRNASDNRDTLKRLIFIYPFGVDQSLVNIPFQTYVKGDSDTVMDALRAFFSVSVLKEIFTSNALNLVTLASTYEAKKVEKGKSHFLINALMRGDSQGADTVGMRGEDQTTYPDIDVNTLQTKINEKFKIIKQSLMQDYRLKKMLPFMQVITLQNMLDVPVLTGTFPFQIDTAALFALMSTAIATRTKLDTWENVKKSINTLKRYQFDTVFQMFTVLNNIEQSGKKPNVPDSIASIMLPGGNPTDYQELKSKIAGAITDADKRKYKAAMSDLKTGYAKVYVDNLKDTKLKELERSFLFMLEPDLLMRRFGWSQAPGQASYAARKVTPQTELLFMRTKQEFIEFLGGADPLFSSAYMILAPVYPNHPQWNRTYQSMKEEMVNLVLDNFDDKFFKNVKAEFTTTITKDIESASSSISEMNRVCDSAREDFVSVLNLFNTYLTNRQVLPTFGLEDIQQFSNAVDTLVGKFRQISKNTQDTLSRFFGKDGMNKINSALLSLISEMIDNFFTKFRITNNPDDKLQARLFALDYDEDPVPNFNNPPNMAIPVQQFQQQQAQIQAVRQANAQRRSKLHTAFLSSLAEATRVILQTVFLMSFKLNLCDFVEVADIEFSTAKADVLDLPNYCLALPAEVVQALYVLYTKKNWVDAVLASGSGFNPLNAGSLKQVTKVLALQLGIPNLFVYDRQKQELYYSFRYLGNNNTEKLKMQAVDVFVKNYLNDNNSGISQVFY